MYCNSLLLTLEEQQRTVADIFFSGSIKNSVRFFMKLGKGNVVILSDVL